MPPSVNFACHQVGDNDHQDMAGRGREEPRSIGNLIVAAQPWDPPRVNAAWPGRKRSGRHGRSGGCRESEGIGGVSYPTRHESFARLWNDE